MSYLWIGVIGALSGWVAGQLVIGSRQGIAVDVLAGAIGAWLAVVASRLVVPGAGEGVTISAVVAVGGAILTLFAMNRFMRAIVISRPHSRRR